MKCTVRHLNRTRSKSDFCSSVTLGQPYSSNIGCQIKSSSPVGAVEFVLVIFTETSESSEVHCKQSSNSHLCAVVVILTIVRHKWLRELRDVL